MNHLFGVYTAVTLVTGVALLLVWRHDRALAFPRLLGLAHLVLAATPLAFLAWQQPEPVVRHAGAASLILLDTAYFVLLILGFAHLSRRSLKRTQVGVVAVGFAAMLATLFAAHPALAQAGLAFCATGVGLTAAWWLRRSVPGERWCGILLVLCGLNQFTYVLLGDAGLAWQTSAASVLRLSLCLTLIHAAFDRSVSETHRLRDRYIAMTERSHQGVTVVHRGKVVYANPAFRRIYGVPVNDGVEGLLSPSWIEVTVPPEERAASMARMRRLLKGEIGYAEWDGERTALDGRHLRLRFSAWPVEWDGGRALQMVVTDETARHDATQALLWQATHDELTGLPNRGALLQRLREACREGAGPLVLVVLDVDRFKLFNEAHGHQVGDAVLRALARRLADAVGEQAELTRLGEDEFALLAASGDEDPQQTARRLTSMVRQLLEQTVDVPDHQFFLDVSMGVALYPLSGDTPEALLQSAHAAMHEAKRIPGTSVQVAEPRIRHGLAAVLKAEQSLRAGLRNEEFALVYQPKVAAASGRLVGFEALVRWDRPGIGRVSPLDFIPAAERTGLIVPLGAMILAQACRQLAMWQAAGLKVVPVAVNVSPWQLLDASFPSAVMATLQAHRVPPEMLTLEITESAAVTHMEQAREQIAALRSQGVEVALDDFGTGFSSLNMLRSLPLRTVKIDRTLIDPMPLPEATAVVRAICDLASTLHLDVVAEGVETPEHAAAAMAAGCDVLQGYLYAKPLDEPQAAGWLSAHT